MDLGNIKMSVLSYLLVFIVIALGYVKSPYNHTFPKYSSLNSIKGAKPLNNSEMSPNWL